MPLGNFAVAVAANLTFFAAFKAAFLANLIKFAASKTSFVANLIQLVGFKTAIVANLIEFVPLDVPKMGRSTRRSSSTGSIVSCSVRHQCAGPYFAPPSIWG